MSSRSSKRCSGSVSPRPSMKAPSPLRSARRRPSWNSRAMAELDLASLSAPMAGENCRAEPFGEQYRNPLRGACAEDRDIWQIYANNFGPNGFDASIDRYLASQANRTFVLFDGDELAGMSSFLGIDPGRQVLEIGGTYYRPHLRGTGFNRRVKAMMLRRAFASGIRRVEFRVDRRNKRSQ